MSKTKSKNETKNETKTDQTSRNLPSPTSSLSQETRDEILRLRPFYGTREIARRVEVGRRIVRRVLQEEGCSAPRTAAARTSKLEPFRDQIEAKVKDQLTITRILRELRKFGYEGERTILADHVRAVRSQLAIETGKKKVKRRFETRPSLEMQVDWSPYKVMIAGVLTLVHALGVLLCYSRKLFVAFFRDERQSTLLEGLARAFAYFDGCALRGVFDRMSTAVLGRTGPDGKPLWHPRFLEFTAHYGFKPFACAVRDPDRKGKKEKSFRLLEADLLRGSSFDSWEDLESRTAIWLDKTPDVGNLRIHGTTRQRPNDAYLAERDLLIHLPTHRFPVYDQGVRIVDQDSTLSIDGTRYTVPAHLACRSVAVRLFVGHFEVLDNLGRIAFSRSYVGPADHGKLIIDPTHYAALPRRPRGQGNGERLDEAFVRRFPSLRPLVDGLKLRMKAVAGIHLSRLVRLADTYKEKAFLAAATRAQDFRRFDAGAVKRILERAHPVPPDEPLRPLNGAGPGLVDNVELATLDRFDHLDHDPVSTRARPQDQTTDSGLQAPATPGKDKKEDEHGS